MSAQLEKAHNQVLLGIEECFDHDCGIRLDDIHLNKYDNSGNSELWNVGKLQVSTSIYIHIYIYRHNCQRDLI